MPLRTDGAALRERRELMGLTIVEFAKLAEYSPHHVSQVELGHENGGPRFQRKAAQILKCQIEDITSGSIPRRGTESAEIAEVTGAA